ncbi:hypothetical protein ACFQ7G_39075 [Streptomyces massasporeus]
MGALTFGRRGGVLGALGASLLLLTGCSTDPAASKGTPAAEQTPAMRSSVGLHLPLQDYLYSDADLRTVKQAMRTLTEKCMRRHKVTHDFGPPPPAMGPRSITDRRYGLTDARMARTTGYHLGDRDPRTHPVPERTPPTGKALTVIAGTGSPTEVNGVRVPARGCAGEAEREIVGSGRLGSSDLAQDLNGESFTATKADPRVVKAFRAWSRCMKERGHAYPDPLAVMNDKRFQGNTPAPPEIEVATADVACKARTDVTGIWYRAEVAYQKTLIARNEKALAAVREQKRDQLAAARAAG